MAFRQRYTASLGGEPPALWDYSPRRPEWNLRSGSFFLTGLHRWVGQRKGCSLKLVSGPLLTNSGTWQRPSLIALAISNLSRYIDERSNCLR
ncbi:hypothetical protein CEXT_155711 [Caerostris extrusa]|uniref:Uncharacterized protein n=1 Tax=Caerostris extrusa TaxID=172846 RepID=A0AAV4MPZ8_CAEEX|nr:hypothetical protein CEXT_155711 [Caerostris extrusa]